MRSNGFVIPFFFFLFTEIIDKCSEELDSCVFLMGTCSCSYKLMVCLVFDEIKTCFFWG